jgi:hypothetical protein
VLNRIREYSGGSWSKKMMVIQMGDDAKLKGVRSRLCTSSRNEGRLGRPMYLSSG